MASLSRGLNSSFEDLKFQVERSGQQSGTLSTNRPHYSFADRKSSARTHGEQQSFIPRSVKLTPNNRGTSGGEFQNITLVPGGDDWEIFIDDSSIILLRNSGLPASEIKKNPLSIYSSVSETSRFFNSPSTILKNRLHVTFPNWQKHSEPITLRCVITLVKGVFCNNPL